VNMSVGEMEDQLSQDLEHTAVEYEELPKSVSRCIRCGEEMEINGEDYFNALLRTAKVPLFACANCKAGINRDQNALTDDDNKKNNKVKMGKSLSIDIVESPVYDACKKISATTFQQTFRPFDTKLRPAGKRKTGDPESAVKVIRESLDTTGWMFQSDSADDKCNRGGKVTEKVKQALAKGKLKVKVNCIYCSTEILTTNKAHKQLMARMMGQTGAGGSAQAQVKYICKSCHSAGLKVPVTKEEKEKIAKWKAMAEKKAKITKASKKAKNNRTSELCPYCGGTFPSGKKFEYHLNKELGISPFKCKVAGCTHAEFSPAARQRHLAKMHGIVQEQGPTPSRYIQCDVCGIAVSPTQIDSHMERHNNLDFKHVCTLCFFRFKTKRSLNSHVVLTGHGELPKQWHCECGKGFGGKTVENSNTKQLDREYLQHLKATCWAHPDIENNLPFKCQHCSERLRTKRGLDIHVGKYHADFYYTCEKCGMKHSNKNLHLRHSLKCSGLQPKEASYKCTGCGKSFKAESTRYDHVRWRCPVLNGLQT